MGTKRVLKTLIICALIVISITCFSPIVKMQAHAANPVYGNFEYIVEDNNEITIIGYNGTDTSVSIPSTIDGKKVTQVGACAFEDNLNIINVTLPKTITQINYKAFADCKNLETINFPDGLKEIDSYAFTTCHSLKAIKLGNQLESIGDCAFQLCISLTEITVPGSVEYIPDHAFHGCYSLKKLVFKEGVTTIDKTAALNLYSLERIILPKSVTQIGDYALGYSVYYPNYTRIATTIYGYSGTASEAYATSGGFKFVALDKAGYTDVDKKKWYYEFVDYVVKKGIMSGKEMLDDGSIVFGPEMNMTRAEFAQVLYNIEGQPSVEYKEKFTDVKNSKWYTNAIVWASEKGIVSGYTNGKFGVSDSITREQMATMLYKYAQYKGYDVNVSCELGAYVDKAKISSWAVKYMKWAVASNVISGKNDKLDPIGNATRAECATMLKKFIDRYQK